LKKNVAKFKSTFSLIYINSSLHHIADIDSFLAFCANLLKPGGKLFAENEPTNKAKFHNLLSPSQPVDLLALQEVTFSQKIEKSVSATRMAEIWDGSGFSRFKIEDQLKSAGFTLSSWEPDAWLSYIFAHMVQSALLGNAGQRPSLEYASLLQKLLEIDRTIRSIVNSEFAEQNFFTVRFSASRI
jgi:hypothetical protein